MTARYDGILMTDVKRKEVIACCRPMDEAAMRGQFYVSTKGALMLRRNDKANAGTPCVCCPFCGARLGATPVIVLEPSSDHKEAILKDAPTLKAVLEGTPVTPVDVHPESPQYALWCEQAERGEGPLAVPREGEE